MAEISKIEADRKKKSNEVEISLRAVFDIVLFALLIVLILKIFILDFFRIPSSSMEDTLLPGDQIIVSRAGYYFGLPPAIPFLNIKNPLDIKIWYREIRKGDIICFHHPDQIGKKLIKRVAHAPGDTIYISPERADSNVNFERIAVPAENSVAELTENVPEMILTAIKRDGADILKVNDEYYINGKKSRKYTFSRDFYYVLGDNYNNSIDSRQWGLVPQNLIIGKPLFIYWSSENRGSEEKIRSSRIGTWVK